MTKSVARLTLAAFILVTASIASADTTLIYAGELLADPGEAPKTDQTIVVEDQRIVEVRDGFVATGEFESDVMVIDLKDRFVLPGLMDMHVHLQFELGPKKRQRPAQDVLLSSSK